MINIEKKFNFAKLHRALWLWISKHPEKDRNDWPQWKFNGGNIPAISNDCFACEVTIHKDSCTKCPLLWPDGFYCGADKDSLYQIFYNARMYKKPNAASLAAEIAHLEWVGQQIFKLYVTE